MKVDTMRQVDYYAGVPLCLLATLLVRLLGVFGRTPAGPPKNVLFIELSEMGSTVLVDPAMRKLKDKTGAELHFAIFAGNAESLRLLDTVPSANIFKIRDDGLLSLAVDTLRFLWWTRARRIDTVLDLELFSRYTALLTGLSGASRRVGFHAFHNEGLYRGSMLTHAVAYNSHLHIAKNFIALINAALSERQELPYSKTLIDDAEIELAQATIEPAQSAAMHERVREACTDYDVDYHRIVLINPNASDLLPQRRWPADSFVQVMRAILGEHENALILITGAPAERDEAERLRQRVDHARCVNFAGNVKLRELPALYTIATLLLTNDSGPGHFSAVTALRTFVLFGPETPRLYGSLGNSTAIYAGLACSPCVSASNHRKTPCHDNVCMQVIEPDYVLEQLRGALG